ncbi:ankyrin repeat domain-containing protein [uncultured Formosa sp.]|uniref:ankyrin repeat domain-containing protein n=1 Tax=uncultured Formosa sp. TaxID=255435 RepID=UPI002637B13C|nr:ankyrin repeat domain-containing protein [uncultured Formosa sp.]
MNFIKTSLCLLTCVSLVACGKSTNSQTKTAETVIETPVIPTVKTEKFNIESLLESAQNGNLDAIKAAINNGFDPNTRGLENRTVLMFSSFNGHTELVKTLLDNGATIDLKDTTNRTALMYACTGPFATTVKVLLEAGAQVNLKDNHEQWTPIMFAAGEGQIEVMQLLLDAGADVNALDIDGESSYDFAISNNHEEAAKFLKPLMKK